MSHSAPVSCENIQTNTLEYRPSWNKKTFSRLSAVDWKKDSCQIKFSFNDSSDFQVYIDFKAQSKGESMRQRDHVLSVLNKAHSEKKKPFRDRFGFDDWTFMCDQFVSPNEAFKLACDMGYDVSIIYKAEGSRERFDALGIKLVPGENGKEFYKGELLSYFTPYGVNL